LDLYATDLRNESEFWNIDPDPIPDNIATEYLDLGTRYLEPDIRIDYHFPKLFNLQISGTNLDFGTEYGS